MVDLPQGAEIVATRWVSTIKYHFDGTIEIYKAYIVAKIIYRHMRLIYLRLSLRCQGSEPFV